MLPKTYKPKALGGEEVIEKTSYSVMLENSLEEFDSLFGPFDTIEQALEMVPLEKLCCYITQTKSTGSIGIIRKMYVWNEDHWLRVTSDE